MRERLGSDAVYLIHELQPDLVLLDLDTVPSSPSAFVAKIGELHPDSKIVVLSAKETAAPVLDALLTVPRGIWSKVPVAERRSSRHCMPSAEERPSSAPSWRE